MYNVINLFGTTIFGQAYCSPVVVTNNYLPSPPVPNIAKPSVMSRPQNPFYNIQLTIQGPDVIVQYQIDPTFRGIYPFILQLVAYKDEGFLEPLYTVLGDPTQFFIIDNTAVRQNQLPSFYYKLQLTTAVGLVYQSEFFGWTDGNSITQRKYLLASEIVRREKVRFNYVGLNCYLLKRKAYVPENLRDEDPITGEAVVDNNSTFGVGLIGGYYNPILVRVSIEDSSIKTDYNPEGKGTSYMEMVKLRSAGFPFIDQHDIVVIGNGKRYIVSDINNIYFPGSTLILLQMPTLRLVPNTDTIYQIACPSIPSNE